VDTSTTSRRLAALEETVGVRLFDRTRDGLLPTSAAEQLLVGAEEAERGMLHVARAATGLERRVEGTVRLTAPPGMAELFLAPTMIELHRRHPALVIELDASQAVLDLSRREADIALRNVRPEGGDLVLTKLATTSYAPFVSQAWNRKKPANVPWIGWTDAYAHIPAARWLARHVDARSVVLRASSLGAQLAAVASGLGAALLPSAIGERQGLTELPHGRELADLPIEDTWLVGHRALREVPRVAAVWDFILGEAARFGRAGGASRSRGPAGALRRRRPAIERR
jgi:DNA-binding transcriptional LysR family regulator